MEYTLRNSIGFHLSSITNRLHAMFSKRIEPYNIAPEQFATLKMISEDGDVNQSKIAAMLAKGKPTVSRTLDALEKKGLIFRGESGADRRIKQIHLSEEGKKTLDAVIPMAKEFNDTLRKQLSAQEIQTFFKVLETIDETIKQYDKSGEKNNEA